ncbi:MAG: dTDP-4-dehydrorhamnose reductase [Anaerolineales bacterium]|nr:dTDP-4-dehydrorhamnose reductase [Anaerolineales bacterium]
MKILLFGRDGQVGWELQRTLAPLGMVEALDLPDLDLANAQALEKKILVSRPNVIVNAAAYTAVDRAEEDRALAFAVNAKAPGVMAEAARRVGAGLIHFSTDFVFDGSADRPYTEADPPRPLNQYGLSKLAGEEEVLRAWEACLVLRTSWVYSLRGDSFVCKVLAWSRKNLTLRIVADQTGSPSWARMLAEVVTILLGRCGSDPAGYLREVGGLYHLAGAGKVSRFAWAQAILDLDPHPERRVARMLEPASSDEFPTPAVRPVFSALDCARFTTTFGLQLPAWEQSLALAMQERQE